MSLAFRLPDPDASEVLGRALAASLPAQAVVHLHGELGAGKSFLARAMLRALGVKGPIKSPTYSLVEQYSLDEGEAAHLDLYRIADSGELDFLALDALAGLRLWLVEWPERGGRALPAADLVVELEREGEGRLASLRAPTRAGAAWLVALASDASLRDFSEVNPRNPA